MWLLAKSFVSGSRLGLTTREQPNETERKRIAKFMQDSLHYLISAGYEAVGVEDFQEMVSEFFDQDILQLKTSDDVVKLFSNKGESEHIVWYARALCAAYMKLNGDRFLPFLGEEYLTIEEYCSREVEPQGKECEQLHIIALAEVLQIRVLIEYISATESNCVTLGPEGCALTISFLYRPGHYDVLYGSD
jgi:ubiquitin thioesterase protein OTUB1